MSRLTRLDVVASTFRNAIFEASTLNIFDAEERQYERFDAQVLEQCYRKLDTMPEENIETFAQCIDLGFQVNYDRDKEDFFVIVE